MLHSGQNDSRSGSCEYWPFSRGLLVLDCGGKSIRLSLPLVITAEQARTGLELLGETLAAVAS